jgi:hypothetical protein
MSAEEVNNLPQVNWDDIRQQVKGYRFMICQDEPAYFACSTPSTFPFLQIS